MNETVDVFMTFFLANYAKTQSRNNIDSDFKYKLLNK